jgi:hypothetical protein
MNLISIIVPTFNLIESRFRNFDFLLTNFLSKLNIKILVSEQKSDNKITLIQTLISDLDQDNIIYNPIYIKDNKFHKTKVINNSVKLVDSKYTWMLDADVFLRYQKIIDNIKNQDVIHPFDLVLHLSDKQTISFIKNKKFIVNKGDKFRICKKFGPLSFIIKTELFLDNLMNEEFVGYGWEDFEFSNRIQKKYKVDQINLKGLHLYHELSPNMDKEEIINRKLFNNLSSVLTFSNVSNSITHLKKLKDVKIKPASKIIHIISPALIPDKIELYQRELLAIQSIINEKSDNVINIMVCESDIAKQYQDHFQIVKPERTSGDIGDRRRLVYLSDCFKIASNYGNDNDILFYTNSDCCIAPGCYNRLLNEEYPAIEYHRLDVSDNPTTLDDVFSYPVSLHEQGIDGLALNKEWFLKNLMMIPDFFIGEPHWDTAISGALRTNNISTQNIIDLYHPEHLKTWDTKKLSIAGKHNDKLWRDFLEYGISKIPLIQKPEIPIETSIVLVHYGDNKIRVDVAKRAMKRLKYQNILNSEYIFVEVSNGKTQFPEIKNKPNWNHILIKEKDSNRDIFQKEAMMNIGAKAAKGSIIIFMDNDIWSENSDWLTRIANKIKENPNKVVHGYSLCRDSKSDRLYISTGLNRCRNIENELFENPGLIVGISKDLLIKNNFLNPFFIMGSGDTTILYEYANVDIHLWQASFPRLKNIMREPLKDTDFDFVNCPIIHENHGDVNFSYYANRHYATKYFTKEIFELVKIGSNGLVEWINPNCIERKIVKNRYQIITKEDADRMCNNIIKGKSICVLN